MDTYYCLRMIRQLREKEEICLYGNVLDIGVGELEDLKHFLQREYEQEVLEYPYEAPAFHPDAALWAAITINTAAQLLLYREHNEEEVEDLFPKMEGTLDASSILSADLCLRFLPFILKELSALDPEDALLELLEPTLGRWHYSGINYELQVEQLDFEPIVANSCLHQLYCNRVIAYKKLKLAQHPALSGTISANLGVFKGEIWPTFLKTQPK